MVVFQKRNQRLVQLAQIFHNPRFGPVSTFMNIYHQWESMVGIQIASHSEPAALFGKKLVVHVDSSTWVGHLQFFTEEMKSKLKSHGFQIKEFQLRVGSLKRTIPQNRERDVRSWDRKGSFQELPFKINQSEGMAEIMESLKRLFLKWNEQL